MLKFLKLHACGNDFLIFFKLKKINLLKKYLNKKTGISCDQLFIIKSINYKIKFINIKIYNNNLIEAKNCGNGIRCLSWFFLLKLKKFIFVNFILNKNNIYSWKNGKKHFTTFKTPIINNKIIFRFETKFFNACFVNLLNLHIIFIIRNILSKNIILLKKKILFYFNDTYNIEFIQIIKINVIFIRIFEKNIGETYSCGSGIISSCCYIKKFCLFKKNIYINSLGGNCLIFFIKNFVIINGKVNFCFFGYI
ncbi:hypothetical protein [Candidatus Carsonella ruddii]|uniref:hypothetical protein n=1 Tax=Carsonella ruddii TaxID=114186 RepID=UPI003D9A483E